MKKKKNKEAGERGHKAYFSKANPDKLFVKANMLLQIILVVTLTGFVYPFANY